MTDTSLPANQSASNDSYVNSYTPPASGTAATVPADNQATPNSSPASKPTPAPQAAASDPLAELEKALAEYEAKQQKTTPPPQAATPAPQVATEDPLAELERVLDEYETKYKQRQADQATQPTPPAAPAAQEDALSTDEYRSVLKNEPVEQQSIEEQNIFELLGVNDADEVEKEAFLDELQQALWDDFLEKDLPLLVADDQLAQVKSLGDNQEQVIKKVEQLVPDVEEIMLEKALLLKEEMMWERVAGMKEYYASQPANLAKVDQAEAELKAGHWQAGASLLNSLIA